MPFPDQDEQPGDERRLKREFVILLGLLLITLTVAVAELWRVLSQLV